MSVAAALQRPSLRRTITAVVVLALVGCFVAFLYRAPVAQWGSTSTERAGHVSGDGIVPDADTTWTRSITIDAPPDRVWPWLVQIGAGRAGFYNYDWGEQLFADPIHNATTIHPEWQALRVGDVIHPKPGSDWMVVGLQVDRALVLENPLVQPTDWTWATELRPLVGDRTRVVTRIRSHEGSFFSYALDVPDLILFPRLLTGLKQRAEGNLPGMPGTHTGRPFPLARLPVSGESAVGWLTGIGLAGFAMGPVVGLGRWGRRRPHPWITLGAGFVLAAGYLISSDTPPLHFVRHVWLLGGLTGIAAGALLVRLCRAEATLAEDRSARWFPRAAAAFVETGVFVVLPVSAVWQAATAEGWTSSLAERLATSTGAGAVATFVGSVAWLRGSRPDPRRMVVPAAVLAVAYAATGSAMAALLGAVVYETASSGFVHRFAAPTIHLRRQYGGGVGSERVPWRSGALGHAQRPAHSEVPAHEDRASAKFRQSLLKESSAMPILEP